MPSNTGCGNLGYCCGTAVLQRQKTEQHFAQERLVQLKVFADKKVARIGCYSAPGKSASCSQSSFTLKKGS
jgi:hypothetical protein